jgi:Prokaryotic E2 family C/ThiF family
MALAEYHQRSSLAASQILEGFDPAAFEQRLGTTIVGLAFDAEISNAAEGRQLLDMTVRLLARVYPRLDLTAGPGGTAEVVRLRRLARAINPRIEITRHGASDVGIEVGAVHPRFATSIYAGSDGWDALVSTSSPQACGDTPNPFGAGTAACLATANVFRRVFLDGWDTLLDHNLRLSTYELTRGKTPPDVSNSGWTLGAESVLVGVGAIGMGTVWALSRAPLDGVVHLVDPEDVDVGNLQRYVLARMSDVGRSKVALGAKAFTGQMQARPHKQKWAGFIAEQGFTWSSVLTAMDSAEARVDVQASLPRWLANAWTQPGDLGVSVHPTFGSEGACLGCLYLPTGPERNEDEIVAEALGIPGRLLEVRTLLHLGAPVPDQVFSEIAQALGIPTEEMRRFHGRPIRDLYVEGICGAALLALGDPAQSQRAVHVPLPHQSALAGILLAAALARKAVDRGPGLTAVTRLDVLKPAALDITQPARARGDGRCICEDEDYRSVYGSKYSSD